MVSITTLGGDPEMARAMGDDVRLLREYTGRETLFLGKVAVYSAGATFMAAFPVDKRFLTRGTRLMIHERLMQSTVQLNGPLNTLPASLKAKLHEIEHSIAHPGRGLRELVAGSQRDARRVEGEGAVELVYRGRGGARPGPRPRRDLSRGAGALRLTRAALRLLHRGALQRCEGRFGMAEFTLPKNSKIKARAASHKAPAGREAGQERSRSIATIPTAARTRATTRSRSISTIAGRWCSTR